MASDLVPDTIEELATLPSRIENDRQIVVERTFEDIQAGVKLAQSLKGKFGWGKVQFRQIVSDSAVQR